MLHNVVLLFTIKLPVIVTSLDKVVGAKTSNELHKVDIPFTYKLLL